MAVFVRRLNLCLLVVALTVLPCVVCHGWLRYPPSRGSLRNFGFENEPVNYDVHSQNCGGKTRQWRKNGGKCGVCGDPYDAFPRQHEAPDGRYATGTIVESYTQGGQLRVEVVMTWGHRGWMEFRLCPVKTKHTPATQSCLDRHLLRTTGSNQTRTTVDAFGERESIQLELDLPPDVTCAQCVLQWKYHTGKDWDCDASGCGLGRGQQEEFYGCADIAIEPAIRQSTTTATPATTTTTRSTAPTKTSTTPRRTTSVSPTIAKTTAKATTTSPGKPATTTSTAALKTKTTTTTTRATRTTFTRRSTKSKSEVDAMVWACSSTSAQNSLYLDNWCRGNCLRQFCPKSVCNAACQLLKPYPVG